MSSKACVVLGSGDEEDAPRCERPQVGKIHVCLVKNHDFSLGKPGAKLLRPDAVVLPGGIDDGEPRQEAPQVHSQVTFGRGFSPPMLRPVHARSHQLDRGRVHHVNRPLELARKPFAGLAADKGRGQVAQVFRHRPE